MCCRKAYHYSPTERKRLSGHRFPYRMKHCPRCQRQFSDMSLNFCLDDGEPLDSDTRFDEDAETLRLNASYDTRPIEIQ